MPPIVILPLVLTQAAAPGVTTLPPPPAPPIAAPRPPVTIRTIPPPPPPPPAPAAGTPAKPRGYPGNWVTSDDYPSRALREEQEGRVGFRVIVNDIGRVTHCEIRESSGWPALDTAACQLITRRARFTPGRDASGAPIESSYSTGVRWVIPNDEPEPVTEGSSGRSFIVEADGGQSDCREWTAPLPAPGMKSTCNSAEFFVPYRDAAGKPAKRQVIITTVTSMADAD